MPIVDASAAAAPVQATVAASNVAASASAAAPVQVPGAWDPYEPVPYVAPENPYDTSIVDDETEVTLCSLVLIPFHPFCVRSSVIRVRLFLVQSFCVRSCVISVCDLLLFKIRLTYVSNQSLPVNFFFEQEL
jgi:hypothetical protein